MARNRVGRITILYTVVARNGASRYHHEIGFLGNNLAGFYVSAGAHFNAKSINFLFQPISDIADRVEKRSAFRHRDLSAKILRSLHQGYPVALQPGHAGGFHTRRSAPDYHDMTGLQSGDAQN